TNNSQYRNATTATLTVTGITAGMTGLQYRCNVSDGAVVSSGAATLTVNANTAPVVQTGNVRATICALGGGSLTTQASTATNYQWQSSTDGGVSWTNLTDGAVYTGSSSAGGTLTISTATGLNGVLYHYVATDGSGCSATSGVDTLFVLQPVVTPSSTSATTNITVCPGGSTTLTPSISSPVALTYQWQQSTTNISDNSNFSGTNTAALTISNITTSMNGLRYRIQVKDTLPCTTFSGFYALVVPSVSLTASPQNTTVCAGSAVTFSATATATGGTATRQWQTDNGTTAAGGPVVWSNLATTTSLTLSTATLSQDGYHYRVIISSAGGCNSVTSAEAVLHVAASGTWLGAVDTNWHVAGNWCGGVPTSTTDVLVPNWAPRMPTISPTTADAFWQSIKIEDAAGLRITGGNYPYNLATSVYNLQGSVAYLADANQYILPATHGSLTVGGSLNKLLQTNTSVLHTLTLGGSAKLVTGTNILTMKAGSNPIAGAVFGSTASSWIVTGNGTAGASNTGLGGLTIEQVGSGSGAVLYPIGATTTAHNPANVTNTGTTDNFNLRVNDQPLPGTMYNSGVNNTWFLTEQVPGGSNIALNLQWNQPQEQSSYARTASQILRSDGTSIVQFTTTLPVAGGNPYTSSGGSFSSLTQFSVASYSLLLPVRLTAFGARRAGALNQIDWQVEGQGQPGSYILERSADGVLFTVIDAIAVVNGKNAYTYLDKDPGNAVSYYRLKMTDADNKNVYYSHTVTVTNQQGLVRAELRPSVTAGNVGNLFVVWPQKAVLHYTLTDAAGRVQLQSSVSLEKGAQTVPLQLGVLARGVYYLRLSGTDGFIKTLSLVKQ
ncbi:MAG: hypothetical protein JST39_12275, partial [Bacteroidetes bacterium]|nr:hypothetical protein [Bacteroidota bacterium]